MDSQIQQQQQSVETIMNGNSENNDMTTLKDTNENSYDDLFPSLATSSAPNNPIGDWNKRPMLNSPTVTQVYHISMEDRKDQISEFGGDDSRALKAAMAKSGAKIEMAVCKDKSLNFLITGIPQNVNNAKIELLKHFQTQISSTISIPKEHHGAILGKGGSKIIDLEKRSATSIKIPKASEPSDSIVIIGTKEGIEKAIHELKLISQDQSKQSFQVIDIPKIYHPFVLGPHGDHVRALGEKYRNAKINIPPPNVFKDEISVHGELDDVNGVVADIQRIQENMKTKSSTINMEVPKNQHKYVFGPKGQTVQEIFSETGVYVEIPPSDVMSDTITLRGPREKLGLALTKAYEKANSVVKYTIPCKAWLHRYIIGRKGASIQTITSDMPKIHIEFSSNDEIVLEGPTEEVNSVKATLEERVKYYNDAMDYAEVKVDAKYHKFIIGKGGANIKKLKNNSDINIHIPEDVTCDVIRIDGTKEDVAYAKKEMEEMVHKMENEREEDIRIENRFHKQLIGPKGENIQRIRDEFPDVQITFPTLGEYSDIVKIRGPKNEVEKCTKSLKKMGRELKENNYQVKVPIYKQFHKYIIGKGGATIRKIRTETDTKIGLPESESDSDVITITGKKENVEDAQKRLNQIQSEMDNIVNESVDVPPKIHNIMIGAGGKLIQSIMDSCGGVSIKFPQADSGSDKVLIRGPKEDVAKAKKMLMEISQEKQLCSESAVVRANPNLHKFLIGKAGANIQALRDATKATFVFPNTMDKDQEAITIIGTKEAVAKAKKQLEDKIKALDNIVEESMEVDARHHSYFIARRGERLKAIGDEFGGVIISFPRLGVDSSVVTFKGAKDCVKGAMEKINFMVNHLDRQVSKSVSIPKNHHASIMGMRGLKLQKICTDFNVQIKFPDRNSECDEIGVVGLEEEVDGAILALEDSVPIDEIVQVQASYHRHIIGQKGSGIRALMAENDVIIKIPPSEEKCDSIVITGSRKNVEGAKNSLAKRVDEIKGEEEDRVLKSFQVTVEVDPEYHPKIIGRKGAVIQQLRADNDVNIQLPSRDSPTGTLITITGYEAQAQKAKEDILKIVSDIEAQAKEEVNIDHRIHPMIIGKGGKNIKKIMADYKVNIKLPRDTDENPNLVVIMGTEDDVFDCKQHLLDKEEEFMQEVAEKEEMDVYVKSSVNNSQQEQKPKDFIVGKGAPWNIQSDETFPSLGNNGLAAAAPAAPVWGPRR